MVVTFKLLLREGGLRAMTKGLSARIISMFMSSLVIVLGYETVKRLSIKTEEHHHIQVEDRAM